MIPDIDWNSFPTLPSPLPSNSEAKIRNAATGIIMSFEERLMKVLG